MPSRGTGNFSQHKVWGCACELAFLGRGLGSIFPYDFYFRGCEEGCLSNRARKRDAGIALGAVVEKRVLLFAQNDKIRGGTGGGIALRAIVAHPSRKDKYPAWVGHPFCGDLLD